MFKIPCPLKNMKRVFRMKDCVLVLLDTVQAPREFWVKILSGRGARLYEKGGQAYHNPCKCYGRVTSNIAFES